MNIEQARRLEAWTWAAESLGIEATPERLAGMAELTDCVPVENLRDAIKAAIRVNPSSFLPSVQSVIASSRRISSDRREIAEAASREYDRALLRAEINADPASAKAVMELRALVDSLAQSKRMGRG